MIEEVQQAELEARWSAWLIARNRRGTLSSLWLVIVLYPLFGILDYLLAPRAWLPVLYGTRALITIVTLVMFRLVNRSIFERHVNLLSGGYQILIACGISLMTVQMGGLASPYYAGLSLILVGIGLLFVWPPRVVATVQIGVVVSFFLPNFLLNPRSLGFTAVSNLFFLASTALVAGGGQVLGYRTGREQVARELVIESTKANLERAHVRLQQLDKFKSEFFANITHELKTPLTMILAPLELMIQGETGKLTEAQRATLQSMLRSGVKLLKLIGDLLDLSKLDESRLRLQIAEHDLAEYLRGLVLQVQSLAQRKSVELTFDSNVESCRVYCDLERMERVFVNLLSNACKFTPPRGKVRVSLHDEGDIVRVAVIDTGIGFPPGMADMLFERFVQVDMGGTRKFGGTGLGLALARELVWLHRGGIRAENGASGGATFTVELLKGRGHFDPESLDRRARQEARAAGNRESDHGIGEWQVEAMSHYRLLDIDEATDQRVIDRDPDEDQRQQSVLVVEDTPDVIRVIHLALRSQFRIFAAPGGGKGFELAVEHLPSLIITDMMMPEIDGMELTRRLRTDARTRHIPIVMLTARSDVEDRIAGLEAGVNAYLAKPFSTKELVSTVRSLVRIQETTADLVLTHNMDSLETIAGGLAHEINNPLNYIKNALSLIRRDVDAVVARTRKDVPTPGDAAPALVAIDHYARLEKMFDVAETGLRRIGATVVLMQRYSREGYTRTFQPLDVFEATRDVASVLQAGMTRPVVEMLFDGDGQIECVPEEMNQVLTNLIQNALDALPRDGTGWVRVNAKGRDDLLVISVQDNGSGIRPEERAMIFTPFFTTKDVGEGMGLGLTIVHRVVASLGGTVGVTSTVGVGTEFTLRIPRATRRLSTPPPPPPPERASRKLVADG
jgi:signal transduction histidine kinase